MLIAVGVFLKHWQMINNILSFTACAVELYQVSSLRMIGHHLLCLLNGNYAPIQCDGRYCSCVDEQGTPIGPSVSVQNRNQLRCVGVYQQLHPGMHQFSSNRMIFMLMFFLYN